MSIIEKAVDKLGKQNSTDNTGEETLSTAAVEQAVEEPVQPRTPPRPSDETLIQPKTSRPASPVSKEPIGLPLESLATQGYLTPSTPRSQIAEEFRTIKRPLLSNIAKKMPGDHNNYANLIMVTSALQGDGKSFVSINLAMSIALEQDKTVLFVDADVAKATAGTALGIPKTQPGLIDVLENKGVGLEDTILPTCIPNFKVLPAGNVHERSTELLASNEMHRLMEELAERYDDRVIVFDSPPLLLTTEAGVLASFMGQIAFVASTDETPHDAITEALSHVGDDKIIGMILNKTHKRRNRLLGLSFNSYGYGYGYGYGHKPNASTEQVNP